MASKGTNPIPLPARAADPKACLEGIGYVTNGGPPSFAIISQKACALFPPCQPSAVRSQIPRRMDRKADEIQDVILTVSRREKDPYAIHPNP